MGGKSKSTTTQKQQTTSQQASTASTTLNDGFKSLQDNILKQATSITGGFNNAGFQQANDKFLGVVNDTIGGQYLDPARNPTLKGYLDAAINPLKDNLAKTSLSIGDASQLAGAYGGGRQRVLSDQALKDFNASALDAASKIYYTDYATERQNQLAAGSLLQQTAANQTAALDPIKSLAAISSLFAPYNATTNSSGTASGTADSTSTTVQQQSMLQNIAMLATAFGGFGK